MTRLRAGKRHGAGSTPGAYSDTMSPRSITRRASSAWAAGYTRSTPQPRTATVVPPASIAPRCASPSTPRARPLTTTRPAAASSRPSVLATEAPYGEHERAPTIATAGPLEQRRVLVAAHEEPDRRVEDRREATRKRRCGASQPADPLRLDRYEVALLVELTDESRKARRARLGDEM